MEALGLKLLFSENTCCKLKEPRTLEQVAVPNIIMEMVLEVEKDVMILQVNILYIVARLRSVSAHVFDPVISVAIDSRAALPADKSDGYTELALASKPVSEEILESVPVSTIRLFELTWDQTKCLQPSCIQ